jgi:uncharacterized membrane protein SpoIIM required for sporulation
MAHFLHTLKIFTAMLLVVISFGILFLFFGWYTLIFIGLVAMWAIASAMAEKQTKPSR